MLVFWFSLASACLLGVFQALSDQVGLGMVGSALLSYSPEFIAMCEFVSAKMQGIFSGEPLSSLTGA